MRKEIFLFAVFLAAITLVSATIMQNYWQTAFVGTQGGLEDPLEAWSESEVIVWQYNSTFYASRNMSTLMVIDLANNSTAVLDNALGNVTILGGQVFVRSGSYGTINANVRNWTRFTIEKNATGITASAVAGGTCIIEDWNAGRIRWYKAGVLVWDANMDSGTLTTTNAIFSTWMNSTSINGNNYYLNNSLLSFIQPYSFIINVTGSTCNAWHGANSTLFTSSTNASAVINNAFGNASLVKGSVFLKSGTYNVNQTTISSNTKVFGEGAGTIIQLANGTALSRPFYVYQAENVTISDLTIDCNIAYYNNSGTNVYGIEISDSSHVTVENVVVKDSRHYGIFVFSTIDSHDVNILHNKLINSLYNGITFSTFGAGAALHDCLVDGNYVEGAGDIGINTQISAGGAGAANPSRIHIINNNINGTLSTYKLYGSTPHNSTGSGIKLENAEDCWVEGNQIYVVCTGIDETSGGNNTFIGNQVWCDGEESLTGIFILNKFETVMNNRVYGGYHDWTVLVTINADNCTVTGNTLINEGGNANVGGIWSDNNCNSTIVMNNIVFACGLGGFSFGTGAYNIVHNNVWNSVYSVDN